jgi:hypothetical protein
MMMPGRRPVFVDALKASMMLAAVVGGLLLVRRRG